VPRVLKWLLVLLVIIIVGAGGFFAGRFYWERSSKSSAKSPDSSATSSAGTKSAGNNQVAEGAQKGCWKTYKTVPVGYRIDYPCDWNLTETNEFSETSQMNVKHITIRTPDNKYFLYWGYKKSAEQGFENNDRTGVGAGDFFPKPNMALSILGVNVTPRALVYQNKIKEYFYEEPQAGIAQCACNFVGYFSYDMSQDYDQVDMTNLDYVTTVKQILLSAKKI